MMIPERFSRTELLLGEEAMLSLRRARVAIFGVGGVGGYVAEALARSGVGSFVLVDHDTVCESNLNRQVIATVKTIGLSKVDVMKERILDINPDASVNVHKCFFLPENADRFDFSDYDYVVDAVDTVTAKLEIVLRAKEANVPVISAMGAGNKLNPAGFCVTDLYQTTVCPLARVMRRECKKRGILSLKVVYSPEAPLQPKSVRQEEPLPDADEIEKRDTARTRAVPGSVAFVPSVAGLILAGEVVKDLIASGHR